MGTQKETLLIWKKTGFNMIIKGYWYTNISLFNLDVKSLIYVSYLLEC